MKLKLGAKKRLILLNIVAGVRGNLTELRILREVKEALSFSEGEHAALKIQERNGRLHWDTKADEPKEIEIGEVAKHIIVRRFKELNKQGQLAQDHLDIVDLFPEVEE
ncbi:MAG: hypothetical protein GTO63_37405 [Anaerolineae bacterium]|nr:hypothetical protein [Anaerolineae bacterium]NIO00441.1 hypothetical protein [Anaerolineae bacterium]NIQ83201.1 hypothetical protein [Anaerolineae bacterium]